VVRLILCQQTVMRPPVLRPHIMYKTCFGNYPVSTDSAAGLVAVSTTP
jgi:hypothetical protein